MQIMRLQKVFNNFKITNLEKYHDLYAQSNILLLADVFENYMCVAIVD